MAFESCSNPFFFGSASFTAVEQVHHTFLTDEDQQVDFFLQVGGGYQTSTPDFDWPAAGTPNCAA
jgi:hypothetical protein